MTRLNPHKIKDIGAREWSIARRALGGEHIASLNREYRTSKVSYIVQACCLKGAPVTYKNLLRRDLLRRPYVPMGDLRRHWWLFEKFFPGGILEDSDGI